jgi:putative DNA primase/helicase
MANTDGQVYFQGEMIPRSIYTHIKEDLCVLQVQDALALGEEVLAPFLSSRCERVGATGAAFWVACPGFSGSALVRDAAGEVQGTFSRCQDLPGGEGEIATIALEDLPFPTSGREQPIAGPEDCPECDGGVEACETIAPPETPAEPIEVPAADPPAPLVEPTDFPPLMRFDVIDRAGAADLAKCLEMWAHDIQGVTLPAGLDLMTLDEIRQVAKEVSVSPAAKEYYLAEEDRKARMAEAHRYDEFAIITSAGIKLHIAGVAALLREEFHALTYQGTLYIYDEGTGLYRENKGQVECRVQTIAEAVGFSGRIITAKREVLSYVQDHNIATEYPFNQYPGIPCKNGVLIIDYEAGTRDLHPYSPEMGFTYKLPVTYDPTADPGPIADVIRSWVEPEDVPLLYQIPAQALLQASALEKPFKKTYLLQGDGNAGKTTYLELLYAVFGMENCSGIALQRLGADRFAKGAMEGRILNVYDDLSEVPLSNVGELKTLTGVFFHNIERKGKDSYQGKIFCVFLFTCNAPPTFDSAVKNDSAFWERWQYVVFPNSFPVDPTFKGRAFTPANLSGFFNAVVDAAIMIRQRRKLLVDSNAYEVRDKWTCNSDPLYRFIMENLEKREKSYIKKDDFYEAVKKFWACENIDPAKMPATKEILSQKLFTYGFTDERKRLNGEQVRFYGGYDWKIDSKYKTEVNHD